mmetsp:Transcript_73391/g.166350  ORF Transcript_73391/g.166350 Transcript_73391/m.166350 type:complete len:265 (-) Transcript_73391:10-804(-)
MTPVISYWSAKDMLWLDGTGPDKRGPCKEDLAECGESASFSGFTLEDIPGGPANGGLLTTSTVESSTAAPSTETTTSASASRPAAPSAPTQGPEPAPAQPPEEPAEPSGPAARCAPAAVDCRRSGCCSQPGMQCFEKNKWWASCREACVPGFGRLGADTSWTCRPLGPRTPDTRRHDEVVLRVVSAEVPANGTEVTVVLGQKQLRAQIFTQNKTDTSKALNVTQAAEARRRKGGRSGASNGTLDGAVRRKASSSTTTTTQVLHV